MELKARSASEKRAMAEYLEQHDPDTLAFLKAAANEFGILETVTYEKTND